MPALDPETRAVSSSHASIGLIQADFDWVENAKCKEIQNPSLFYDGTDAELRAVAIRWCDDCPARVDCREFAIVNRIWDGVWGGMLPQERRREMARRRRTSRASGG